MGRTLVVTSTFPQWEGDPRGGFIRRFWERRADTGERVEVLAPRTRWCAGELDSPLHTRRFSYAPPRCSTVSGQFGILENIRACPRRALLLPPFVVAMYWAIQRRLASERWDRLIAHMVMPCGVVAGVAAARHGVPLEVYGHGTDVDVVLRAPASMRRLAQAALAHAQTIYVPSQEKRARLCAALPQLAARCRVATMVETVVEEPVERRPVSGRILFLGRLIQQKGVDDLIRAVAELDGAAHLHIAGDGPERARLAKLAARLGAEVVFLGFVEGARKREALASASVVCVPSREVRGLSEGTPLVVREASVQGLPVVVTGVGGIPELVAELGSGERELVTLVPPSDHEALREALLHRVQAERARALRCG